MRSLFPKIKNFKRDFLERSIDVSLCSEIWEDSEKVIHKKEIEKMFELDGLQYFSTSRKGKRGGGVAIIVNSTTYEAEKLKVTIPNNVEIIWVLAKPKISCRKSETIILS